MTHTLKDNPTSQEAADFFSEKPHERIKRLEIHVDLLEKARVIEKKTRDDKITQLETINTELLEACEALLKIVYRMGEELPDMTISFGLAQLIIEARNKGNDAIKKARTPCN